MIGRIVTVAGVLFLSIVTVHAGDGRDGEGGDLLEGTFDFSRPRISEKRYYEVRSEATFFSASGGRTRGDACRMLLVAEPPRWGVEADAIYRCFLFTMTDSIGMEFHVPRLEGYTHPFLLNESSVDDRGYLYSIDHGLFSILADALGRPLTSRQKTAAYDAFIDFHRFCDYYARPTFLGKGIQDLHRVGDSVIHAAAYRLLPEAERRETTEPTTTSRNGEVTLEFLGISLRGGEQCALMRVDSGECSRFYTNNRGEPVVTGSFRYRADLNVELVSGWVAGAAVVERILAGGPDDGGERPGFLERTFKVRSLSKERFEEILRSGWK